MAAVDKVLEALLIIGASDVPLSAVEIAERLSSPISSAYRHIATLKRFGFIAGDGRDTGFTIGPAAFQLSSKVDRFSFVIPIVKPWLQRLAEDTDESVGLMRVNGNSILCVEMVESSQSLRCSFQRGRGTPLEKGASAKTLLAFMPVAQSQSLISGIEKSGRDDLAKQLEVVRERGYADTEGEVDPGIWGVSAPIYSGNEKMEGCITLMAPAFRVGTRKSHLIAQLRETAAAISKNLSQAFGASINSKQRKS